MTGNNCRIALARIGHSRKGLQRPRPSLKKLNHLITSDAIISHASKDICQHEYDGIRAALGFLDCATPDQALKPQPPFTRRLHRNERDEDAYAWSGQGFWSAIITALRPLWQRLEWRTTKLLRALPRFSQQPFHLTPTNLPS